MAILAGMVSDLSRYCRISKKGIGKSLVNEGLSLLKISGVKGCVLAGDPPYYRRISLRSIPEPVLDSVPQEVFLVLPFGEKVPRGAVVFHKGFSAKG